MIGVHQVLLLLELENTDCIVCILAACINYLPISQPIFNREINKRSISGIL